MTIPTELDTNIMSPHYACPECSWTFSSKQALQNHMHRNVCSRHLDRLDPEERAEVREKGQTAYLIQKTATISDEINELKRENEMLKQTVQQLLTDLLMLKKAVGMHMEPGPINKHDSRGTVIYNNNSGGMNVTFVLNSFGKEDTSHITHEEKLKWAKDPATGVVYYLEKKHFDPSQPENHNIVFTSLKREEVATWDGSTWCRQPVKPLAYQMVEQTLDDLQCGVDWNNITPDSERFFEEVSNDPKCALARPTVQKLIYMIHAKSRKEVMQQCSGR